MKTRTHRYISYLQLARPHQWCKNTIVFAPLLFSGKWSLSASITLLAVFAIFTLLASSVYSLNDVIDSERDANHPLKKNRPIPSGKISRTRAAIFSLLLLLVSTTFTALLIPKLLPIILGYWSIAALYSIALKHLALLDIATITILLLLRLFAGSITIGIELTPSIITATAALGLMLATGKRLIELENSSKDNSRARPVLNHYSTTYLRIFLYLLAATSVSIYCYWLYKNQIQTIDSQLVWLTLIPVLIAIFRYLYLINQNKFTEDPTVGAVKDLVIFTSTLAFTILHGWLILVNSPQLNSHLLSSTTSISTTINLNQHSGNILITNIGTGPLSDITVYFPLVNLELQVASILQPEQSMSRSLSKTQLRDDQLSKLGIYQISYRDQGFRLHQNLHISEKIANPKKLLQLTAPLQLDKDTSLIYSLDHEVNLETIYSTYQSTAAVDAKKRKILLGQIPLWTNNLQLLLVEKDNSMTLIEFTKDYNFSPSLLLWWIFVGVVLLIISRAF